MPDVHVRFPPSVAEQYINCPPSLVLFEQMPDPRPILKRYDSEMQRCAEGYRDMVLEIMQPRDFISVEQKVYLDGYVPDSFGTSDCIIIGNGCMHVIDFKYGMRVKISAEDNAQLKCYTLGAYLAFSPLYDINSITLVIYQPRINNFSTWTLETEALLRWADEVLKPKAELALKGEGELAYGAWCK